MKRRLRNYLPLFAVALIVITLDQISKYLVRTRLPYTEVWAPWDWMLPFARVVHWQNTGAAFGMFQGMSLVFGVLAVIVSAAIIYYYPQVPKEDWLIRLALGMQLGGALGNLIDRLQFGGAVTDFISLGNFAVFNVADASISVGVVLLILGLWLRERRTEQAKRLASTDPSAEPTSTASPEQSNGE